MRGWRAKQLKSNELFTNFGPDTLTRMLTSRRGEILAHRELFEFLKTSYSSISSYIQLNLNLKKKGGASLINYSVFMFVFISTEFHAVPEFVKQRM